MFLKAELKTNSKDGNRFSPSHCYKQYVLLKNNRIDYVTVEP